MTVATDIEVLDLRHFSARQLRPLLEREAEVWRERAFEAILGDSWVTGRFDRVVLTRDSAQKPVGAVIYDFKTDRVATPEEVAAASARHQPQLQWYRQAVQALTGLSLESIRCEVVFTRVRQRVIV